MQQLHVAVIGAQTQRADPAKPYTVFRTAVNFRGQCYQRLIRYRQFRWFHRRLEARDLAALRGAVFPAKQWTRAASLQPDVVEARQVLLNEYMDKVASAELTPGSADRLLQLLKVGDYDVDAVELAASSLKTPATSTSCERSGGGEQSERSHESLGAVAKEIAVGPAIVFRSMTSSAETVLADDEQDERQLAAENPRARDPTPRGRFEQKAARSSVAAAPQPKKVQFDDDLSGRATAPVAGEHEAADVGSPEHKYRRQIEKKMSDIQDMISSFSSLDDAPQSIRT